MKTIFCWNQILKPFHCASYKKEPRNSNWQWINRAKVSTLWGKSADKLTRHLYSLLLPLPSPARPSIYTKHSGTNYPNSLDVWHDIMIYSILYPLITQWRVHFIFASNRDKNGHLSLRFDTQLLNIRPSNILPSFSSLSLWDRLTTPSRLARRIDGL